MVSARLARKSPARLARRYLVPYRTIFATVWVTIASIVFLALIYSLRRILFHLALAAFLALVLHPFVRRLERIRVRRSIAILVVVGASFIAAVGIGGAMTASLASQGVQFASKAPSYLRQAEKGEGPFSKTAKRFHLEKQLKNIGPAISKTLSKLPAKIVELLRQIANGAFSATIIVILSIFILVEGPSLARGFMEFVPEEYKDAFSRIGKSTTSLVSGYTTGVFLLALINGIVAAVALGAAGVPFVLPLAIWAGLIDILPLVGGLLAIIPAALFAFAHSLAAGIVVVSAMLVYQQIKNHVLYPIVIGRAVKLNALMVLIAVLVGAELYGVAGAILAIPLAGIIQAVLVEVIRFQRGEPRPAGEDKPGGALQPGGTD
jgi:predicted PurR-regulated permease PerM